MANGQRNNFKEFCRWSRSRCFIAKCTKYNLFVAKGCFGRCQTGMVVRARFFTCTQIQFDYVQSIIINFINCRLPLWTLKCQTYTIIHLICRNSQKLSKAKIKTFFIRSTNQMEIFSHNWHVSIRHWRPNYRIILGLFICYVFDV